MTHALGTRDDERSFPATDDDKVAEIEQQAEQHRQQELQEAAAVQQAAEQAKQQGRAQAEIAIEQARAHLEAAAKRRELALEGEMARPLLAPMWKERLLPVESTLEAKLMRMGGHRAGANANVE